MENSSARTPQVLTVLVGACGAIGTAVIYSNIEPTAKAWLAVGFFALMTVAILSALGTMGAVRKVIGQSLFDAKLRQRPDRLQHLAILLSQAEKVDSAFHNLSLAFQEGSGLIAPPVADSRPLISPGVHFAANNVLHKMRDAIFKEIGELSPKSRLGSLPTTTELYHALENLCALVLGIGITTEGLVGDANRRPDVTPTRQHAANYETFRQNYTSLMDNLSAYLHQNEVIFGRKLEFEAMRLPALKS